MYGKRLKELRKERNWTIDDVFPKLGVGRSTYSSYETEYRQPPIKVLTKLSEIYDVSVDYIIGITDEREIRKLEYDVKEYLSKNGIHYEGKDLSEDELAPIKQLFEVIVRDRLPKKQKSYNDY